MDNWQPSASRQNLKLRATALAALREFFREQQVMEVETPLLAKFSVTDPHLHSIPVPQISGTQKNYFLQTSPEMAMKRLLASGSGSIYQICKAFRQDESGSRHSPEFTLLEWYRTDFDEWRLMDEVEALVRRLTNRGKIARCSYRELFMHYLQVDPFVCTDDELLAIVHRQLDLHSDACSRDDLLQLLLAQLIEPVLENDCFVYHFPVSMAALAQTESDAQGVQVARRFELFMGRMEIANGYFELTDANEQQRRFAADNEQREQQGLPRIPYDEKLLAALEHGLPVCSGVALGLDRLLMIMAGTDRIEDVLSFTL